MVNLRRCDDALRFPAFDVQEDAGVITTLGPDPGFVPFHILRIERLNPLWHGFQFQVTLGHQPLIDTESAPEGFGAMVGNDQHIGMFIKAPEQGADLKIQILIVLENDLTERITGIESDAVFGHVLPEGVLQAIEADLNQHKQIPTARIQQMAGQLKALPGHLIQFTQQGFPFHIAEVFDIESVLRDGLCDFIKQSRRIKRLFVQPFGGHAGDQVSL